MPERFTLPPEITGSAHRPSEASQPFPHASDNPERAVITDDTKYADLQRAARERGQRVWRDPVTCEVHIVGGESPDTSSVTSETPKTLRTPNGDIVVRRVQTTVSEERFVIEGVGDDSGLPPQLTVAMAREAMNFWNDQKRLHQPAETYPYDGYGDAEDGDRYYDCEASDGESFSQEPPVVKSRVVPTMSFRERRKLAKEENKTAKDYERNRKLKLRHKLGILAVSLPLGFGLGYQHQAGELPSPGALMRTVPVAFWDIVT